MPKLRFPIAVLALVLAAPASNAVTTYYTDYFLNGMHHFNLPFGQPDVTSIFTATSTWDQFIVSGNTVRIEGFTLEGTDQRLEDGGISIISNVGQPGSLSATLDGRMQISYTADFEYTGPVDVLVGMHTEIDYFARGAYVLNDPATGLQMATAAQFDDIVVGDWLAGVPLQGQVLADFFNAVVSGSLPTNWTQAGLWHASGNYTPETTRGGWAEALHGGSYDGVAVWYSTDAFVFGKPIPDADADGRFSAAEVADLIANGDFPEIGGLNLAGNGFAQLYDVHVIEGDGSIQTIVFEYDETILAPGEEPLLSIVHYVNGVWETPSQVLDMDGNTITVTLDSFSPFALVSTPVPLPAGAWLLASALVLLRPRGRWAAAA